MSARVICAGIGPSPIPNQYGTQPEYQLIHVTNKCNHSYWAEKAVNSCRNTKCSGLMNLLIDNKLAIVILNKL